VSVEKINVEMSIATAIVIDLTGFGLGNAAASLRTTIICDIASELRYFILYNFAYILLC